MNPDTAAVSLVFSSCVWRSCPKERSGKLRESMMLTGVGAEEG